jgi:hypothetical protein
MEALIGEECIVVVRGRSQRRIISADETSLTFRVVCLLLVIRVEVCEHETAGVTTTICGSSLALIQTHLTGLKPVITAFFVGRDA